jgi:type II secretory pathway pseudopilin PulG
MSFFFQPCAAPSESVRLGAKQGHATSAKSSTFASKKHSYFRTLPRLRRGFAPSHLSLIQHQKFNIQNREYAPLIPRRLSAAFSLTEVVIAMGVAAVAFTSIIALFPLGLNMSKESYEATQAALVAQTILSDLKDALSTHTNYFPGTGAPKLIQIAGESDRFTTANYTNIELSNNTSQTFYLAYDQKPRSDSTGSPIILRPCSFSTSPTNFYTSGATNGANVIVRVIVEKTLVFESGSESGSDSNPQKIEVSVETPGNAKATNRIQYVFTGIINQS